MCFGSPDRNSDSSLVGEELEDLSVEQVLYDTKDSSIYLLCNYCQELFVFKLSLSFCFYDGFVVGKNETSGFPTMR